MNSRVHRRRRRQRGIALIEVLVAALLISFGLLGLISLQSRATQFSVGADDRARAALLANELASEMWGLGSVNIDAATLEKWEKLAKAPTGGGLPNGTVTVAGLGANTVRITVEWSPPKATDESKNRYTTDVAIPVIPVAPVPPPPAPAP